MQPLSEKLNGKKTHFEKIEKLKSEQRKYDKLKRRLIENIICIFSSCKFIIEKEHALPFSLDDHIPIKHSDIRIKMELERFYH